MHATSHSGTWTGRAMAWPWPLISLLLLTAVAATSANAEARPGSKPSRAQVERLVRDWLKAWENGDRELIRSTLHREILFAYPAVRADYAGTLVEFDRFHADFRDTRVYLHRVIVDGAKFMAEYQFATTRKANGKRQAVGTIAIGVVRDGRLLLVKEYVDGRVSRMQEADQLPVDEGQEPFPWPIVPPKPAAPPQPALPPQPVVPPKPAG